MPSPQSAVDSGEARPFLINPEQYVTPPTAVVPVVCTRAVGGALHFHDVLMAAVAEDEKRSSTLSRRRLRRTQEPPSVSESWHFDLDGFDATRGIEATDEALGTCIRDE